VDFGSAGLLVDPDLGRLRRAWAFVMTSKQDSANRIPSDACRGFTGRSRYSGNCSRKKSDPPRPEGGASPALLVVASRPGIR
jgi:hypothetical protein